ncbi:MAG: hypothetical protein ACRD6W_09115 [Nitrososphaerales archaeon]
MGQPLLRNPIFLLAFATSSLFVGGAFVYMATKSPFFWGGLYLPGVVLLLLFVLAAALSIFSLLRDPVRAAS